MAERTDPPQPMESDQESRRRLESEADRMEDGAIKAVEPEAIPAGSVSSRPSGAQPRKNPFVGPVPLTQEDPIFGRDREIRELYDKLISQRIVVLHSPSGAGKTSLVMAGLLPRLEEEGLLLLPVIRVGGEPEQDYQPPQAFNPYIYNLVLALDSPGADEIADQGGEPESQEIAARRSARHQELAGMSLAEYLGKNAQEQNGVPRAIVFDQFEEIITSTLAGTELKRDFFRQVGEALRDRTLWALFAIREDFLGSLEPYAALIPTQFTITYRLDFLDYTAALEAVRKPLAGQGISYAEQADEQLVNDLRTVLVQTPDGEIRTEKGVYVEPVQLQVVCRRLYDRLDLEHHLEKTQIDRHDLESVGDVNQALAEYYREQVALVGGKKSVERRVRDWFEEYLITKTGLRSQVMMEKDTSGGLDNALIWMLVDAHLVRSDKRRGVTWFELAHDRLVRPVLADNEVWRRSELHRFQQEAWEWSKNMKPEALLLRGKELAQAEAWAAQHTDELDPMDQELLNKSRHWRREHLSWVQLKASQWHEQGRQEGMLLVGDELAQAESWAAENSLEMTEDETAFVAASRKREVEQERIRQQEKITTEIKRNRRRMLFFVIAMVMLGVLTVSISLINSLTRTANANATLAANNAAVSAARSTQAAESDQLASERSTQAAESGALAFAQATLAADKDQLAAVNAQIALTAIAAQATAVAGKDMADQSAQQALARQLASQAGSYLERKPDLGLLLGVEAFRIDPSSWDTRSTLLAGLQNGLEQNVLPEEVNIPTQIENTHALNISPDARRVAWAGFDGKIVIWDRSTRTLRELQDPERFVIYTMAFSPRDPNLLVTGNNNNELLFWNLETGQAERLDVTGTSRDNRRVLHARIRRISFHPDGAILAVHGQSSFIGVWNVNTKEQEIAFDSDADFYWDIEWSPDNRYLAAAGGDNALYIFDPASGNTLVRAPNPDEAGRIYNVDWSRDSQRLAFAGSSGRGIATVQFYELAARRVLPETLDYLSTNIYNVSYNHPDADILVAAGFNGPVVLWRVKDNFQFPPLPEYSNYQNGMAFHRDLLAYLGGDTVNIYSIVVPDQLSRALPPASQDSPFIMSAGLDGALMLFTPDDAGGTLEIRPDAEAGAELSTLNTPSSGSVYQAAFGQDGVLFLLASDAGELYRWSDAQAGVTETLLTGLPDGITALAASPDGMHLAASQCLPSEGELAAADVCTPRLHVWDLTSPEVVSSPITVTQGVVTSLAFSPDGSLLASGSRDGSIALTDLQTGEPARLPLGGYPVSIASLAFSPDGGALAAGTDQGLLYIWDVSSGQVIGSQLNAGVLPVVSLVYSPDGKTLYSGTQNGQLIAWDVDAESWAQRACAIAGRSLSIEEWRQFLPDRIYGSRACR